MKYYYFNPKTQDIHIFDTDSKEMLVLERIMGVRVLTTSDLENSGGDEPVKHWKNSVWNPKSGKARPRYGADDEKENSDAAKPSMPAKRAVSTCKVCGKPGRADYHEKAGLHKDLPPKQ